MLDLNILFPSVLNGITTGAVYALIALGLTLIYGVLHIINFAHGAALMVALYGVYMLKEKLGVDPYLALPIMVPALGAWGSSLEQDGLDIYASFEVDVYGGWTGNLTSGLVADVGVTWYTYPNGTNPVLSGNYLEPYASLSTTVGPATVKVGRSPSRCTFSTRQCWFVVAPPWPPRHDPTKLDNSRAGPIGFRSKHV